MPKLTICGWPSPPFPIPASNSTHCAISRHCCHGVSKSGSVQILNEDPKLPTPPSLMAHNLDAPCVNRRDHAIEFLAWRQPLPPQLVGWCGAGKGERERHIDAESNVSGRELQPRRWDGRRATASIDRLDCCRNKPFHSQDSMSNNSSSEYSARNLPWVRRPLAIAMTLSMALTASGSLVRQISAVPISASSRIARR